MIDSTKDINGQGFNVLRVQLGLSETFTKSASVESTEELEKLASAHFCDPIRRNFPVHTKQASEDSILYFFGSKLDGSVGHNDRATEERLYKAARFWEISPTFYKVKRAFFEAKEAACKEETKEVRTALDGKLPIMNAVQVKSSAESLVAQRDKLTFGRRNEAALNILKAATEMDVEMGTDTFEELEKLGGLIIRSRPDISQSLRERGVSFDRAGLGGEIYKAASESVLSCQNDEVDAICSLIDTYEHEKKSSRVDVGNIEDVFFGVMSSDLVQMQNGSKVSMGAVKSASLTPFYALGATVPLKVTNDNGELNEKKASEYLKSISKEDGDLFVSALDKCKN